MVDAASLSIRAHIPDDVNSASDIAVTPDGRFVYVAATPSSPSGGLPGIRVIDAQTNQVVASIDGRFDGRIMFSPGGSIAYMKSSTTDSPALFAVAVINAVEHHLKFRQTLIPSNELVRSFVLSPDGRSFYGLADFNTVVEFDAISGAVLRRAPLICTCNLGPIALSPDASRILVGPSPDEARVVDIATFTETTPIRYVFPTRFIPAPLRPPTDGLHLDPPAAVYGTWLTVAARLTYGGIGVPGRRVDVYLSGSLVASTLTDAGGFAQAVGVSTVGFNAGFHSDQVAARFDGDGSIPQLNNTKGLTIVPARPVLSWSPSPVLAGQALGSNQLNATADVAGSFEYSPPPGTVTGSTGGIRVSTSFSPSDTVNYFSASVERVIPVFFASAASSLVPEHALSGGPHYASRQLGFEATTSTLYLVRAYGDSKAVWLVNGITDALVSPPLVLQSGSLSAFPRNVAVDSSARRVYVTSDQGLWVFDRDSGSVLEVVPLAGHAITVDPLTGIVYTIAQRFPGRLGIFDPLLPSGDSNRLATIDIGDCHDSVTVNPASRTLYVAGPCDGVQVVDVDPAQPTYRTVIGGFSGVAPVAVNRMTNLVYAATHYLFQTPPASAMIVVQGDRTRSDFNTILARVDLVQQPADLAYPYMTSFSVDAARGLLYAYVTSAVDCCTPTVTSFDLSTNSVAAVWPLLSEDAYIGSVQVNPATNRVYVISAVSTIVLKDASPMMTAVTAGSSTAPVTISVGTTSMTFSDVTVGGQATVQLIDPAAANLELPGRFFLDGAAGYDISTTASVTAPITVCFNMSSVQDPEAFSALRILHGENGSWVDRTVSSDYSTGLVCASVDTLSPFVVARYGARYQTQLMFDNTRTFKRGSTVPIRLRLLDDLGTNTSSPLVTVSAKRLLLSSSTTNAVLQDSGNANPDRNFRYDADLGGYVFNLSTKQLAAGTYQLTFRAAGDTNLHTVAFQIR